MSALYGPPLEGSFAWPAGFQAQRTPTHRHQGADFVVPAGRKWKAVASGVVEHVVREPAPHFAGYGRALVLKFRDEDGEELRALYAHGDSVTVEVGQNVNGGDVLGTVGTSQFRTIQQLRRQGVTVPEGYDRSTDERGALSRASGRAMSPHLHLELARHSYPIPGGSDGPGRIDPRAWFIARGVARARAPGGTPHQGAPAATLTPMPAQQPRQTEDALRVDLMRRVRATDREVERATLMLGSMSMQAVSSTLLNAWLTSRALIVSRVQAAPATVEELRASVEAWLAKVNELRANLAGSAAGLPEALLGQLNAFADRLLQIWHGVQWVIGAVVATAVGGAGVLVLLVVAFMAFGQYTGAKYAYRRGRRALAS